MAHRFGRVKNEPVQIASRLAIRRRSPGRLRRPRACDSPWRGLIVHDFNTEYRHVEPGQPDQGQAAGDQE